MFSKQKIRLLGAVVILAMLFVVACTHKNNPTPTPINPEILKYFNYQFGSYWIYYDSLSGKTDSFYISTSGVSVDGSNNNVNI